MERDGRLRQPGRTCAPRGRVEGRGRAPLGRDRDQHPRQGREVLSHRPRGRHQDRARGLARVQLDRVAVRNRDRRSVSNVIEMNRVKTADDLLKYVDDDDKKTTEPPPLTVSWMLNRHPLLGGDYYRAYRAAVLASARFGWATSVADRMMASTGIEGAPEGKLGFITPNRMMGMPDENARVFFPEIGRASC